MKKIAVLQKLSIKNEPHGNKQKSGNNAQSAGR
jgi:hypothetical protein